MHVGVHACVLPKLNLPYKCNYFESHYGGLFTVFMYHFRLAQVLVSQSPMKVMQQIKQKLLRICTGKRGHMTSVRLPEDGWNDTRLQLDHSVNQ